MSTQDTINEVATLFFGRSHPTPEQAAEGYEHDPVRGQIRPDPCLTYHWCGQDFSHCDNCGDPCWEHPYQPGMGGNAGLRKRQTWEQAQAMWKKWGEPKGIPFRVPRPCLAARSKAQTDPDT